MIRGIARTVPELRIAPERTARFPGRTLWAHVRTKHRLRSADGVPVDERGGQEGIHG